MSLGPLSLRQASTASSHPSFTALPKRIGFIAALLILVSVSSQGAHAQATGGSGGPMGGGGGAARSTYVGLTQELYVSYFNRPADPFGISQSLSGVTVVGSQQAMLSAMNLFITLTNPSESELAAFQSQLGITQSQYDFGNALNYAGIDRKAPPMAPRFEQRWSVWATGFGGSQATDGNAAVGSNNTTSSIYGTAAGADYQFSPDTRAGFALAGGGTNFSTNNLGSGRSDLFQAGAFIRHTVGPAYISAVLPMAGRTSPPIAP
jgi:hypothetical protein